MVGARASFALALCCSEGFEALAASMPIRQKTTWSLLSRTGIITSKILHRPTLISSALKQLSSETKVHAKVTLGKQFSLTLSDLSGALALRQEAAHPAVGPVEPALTPTLQMQLHQTFQLTPIRYKMFSFSGAYPMHLLAHPSQLFNLGLQACELLVTPRASSGHPHQATSLPRTGPMAQ